MAAECGNPLLLGWVKEWWDLARERNSKGATVYKKAYDSLKACPLTFAHPSEAQQLHGLGPKLCARLADKLKEHCEANGLPMPTIRRSRKRKSNSIDGETDDPQADAPAKKSRKTKPYVPTLRSGAYALILALSSVPENSDEGLTKGELIERAQPHCDASFSAPSDPSSFYTAWSSMKTLQTKDFIYEKSRPIRRYLLTDEGWEVAKRIKAKMPQSEPAIREQGRVKDKSSTSLGFLDLDGAMSDEEDVSAPKEPKRNELMSAPLDELSGGILGTVPTDKFGISSAAPRSLTPPRGNKSPEDDFVNLTSSPNPPRIVRPNRPPSPLRTTSRPTHSSTTQSKPPPPPANPKNPSTLPSINPIPLFPSTFTLRLALDTREIRAKHDRDYISSQLSLLDTPPLVQSLPLGDCAWILKLHSPTTSLSSTFAFSGEEPTTELVLLDYILERKRLDDLIYSVKDGRFHEQKFRLRNSGVKNVVYLVEDVNISSEHAQKYGEMVQSAIASTQVVDGWPVKRTRGVDETIRYLARMTKLLTSIYNNNNDEDNNHRPVYLLPTRDLTAENFLPILKSLREKFPERSYAVTGKTFAALSSKNERLVLRDVFLKMLMCGRGMSGEKAIEVQKVWGTPRGLVEGLRAAERSRGGVMSGGFRAIGDGQDDDDDDDDKENRVGNGKGKVTGKATGKGKGKGRESDVKGDMLFKRLGSHPVPRRRIGRELSRKVAAVWGEEDYSRL